MGMMNSFINGAQRPWQPGVLLRSFNSSARGPSFFQAVNAHRDEGLDYF